MTTEVSTSVGMKTLRRDAAQNRERLLDAAATVFADQGLDAGVDDIARLAGVGVGTLYRRFPTKDALISELVRQVFHDFVDIASTAMDMPDGTGLEHVLYGTGAILASNRGCLSRMWNDDETAGLRNEYREKLFELLKQAKEHHHVRMDATESDLDLVFWSLRGVISTTLGITDDGWKRTLAIMIAGLRPGAATIEARPMAADDVSAAMHRLNPR